MHTLPAGPRPCLPPLSRSGLIPPPHLPCLHVTPSPDSPSHPPTHTSTRPWTRPLPHPHTRPHAPSLRLFPSRALVPFRRPGLSFLGVLRLWLFSFPLISGGSSLFFSVKEQKNKSCPTQRKRRRNCGGTSPSYHAAVELETRGPLRVSKHKKANDSLRTAPRFSRTDHAGRNPRQSLIIIRQISFHQKGPITKGALIKDAIKERGRLLLTSAPPPPWVPSVPGAEERAEEWSQTANGSAGLHAVSAGPAWRRTAVSASTAWTKRGLAGRGSANRPVSCVAACA
jgi:hypothetical protein